MLIGGIIALVFAGVALIVWRVQHGSLKAMTLTETLTCGELGELEKAAGDSDGGERQVERTRTVASHVSETPFVVRDATGEIVVETQGATVDNPPVIADHYERDMNKVEIGTGLLANVAEAFLQNDRTIGIERKEWGIAAGQRLYVLAEASDRSGRLAMMKPAEGKFMISTRTEEELRSSKQGFVNIARVLAGVLGAIGVVLVVLGLVL